MTTAHRIIGLLAAAAIVVPLSGCSVVNGLNRTVACSRLAVAATQLKDAEADFSADAADPAAAAATVTKAEDAFDSQMKDVRDADVKTKSDAITSALRTLAADLQKSADDPASADGAKLSADKTALLDAADQAKSLCE
ncbi:hypothetical protein HII28_07655 [Planctomonas sp. JC2975]|uniref:hypothetical protein n=1 Tax=Planctomonas sp. JC2975 TaxID=2729626 RepID=UPI0014738499|nr:hypothetical protein [Planctomonas sp. JC2975]NNC11749.1 hypothetical protein [Planctomonas sp. JC2975]